MFKISTNSEVCRLLIKLIRETFKCWENQSSNIILSKELELKRTFSWTLKSCPVHPILAVLLLNDCYIALVSPVGLWRIFSLVPSALWQLRGLQHSASPESSGARARPHEVRRCVCSRQLLQEVRSVTFAVKMFDSLLLWASLRANASEGPWP